MAALASWLDARAHGGRWLVRIEDIDPPRCQPGADTAILNQLASCGLLPDEEPVWQSRRHNVYESALERLKARGLAYPCGCTRKDVEAAWENLGWTHERHVERPYPGTCRDGLHGKSARAWRFALDRFTRHDPVLHWQDRRLGAQQQDVIDLGHGRTRVEAIPGVGHTDAVGPARIGGAGPILRKAVLAREPEIGDDRAPVGHHVVQPVAADAVRVAHRG